MRELICIVCPKGCHLQVDEASYAVQGHSCPRGEVYGREEIKNPRRVITSTVRTSSALHPRCSVKTDQAIPKELMFQAMDLLNDVDLVPPIACGQVILEHVLGTEANFVATRNIEQ